MPYKECKRCGEDKPYEEWPEPDGFYRHSGMSDGYLNICIECKKAEQNERAASKAVNDPDWVEAEAARQRQKATRKYYEEQRDDPEYWKKQAEYKKNWNARNPEKKRAHRLVRQAVKSGKLTKPDRCEGPNCLKREGVRLHAHHEDYDKPLDVLWFCAHCHAKHHRKH